MMGFAEILSTLDLDALRNEIQGVDEADVRRALTAEHPGEREIAALFSPAAEPLIEDLAQRSSAITERRFGKVVNLYAPLYLSNECANFCTYCGFSRKLDIERTTLTVEQAVAEARLLHDEGFRHILLVSGESPRAVNIDYLLECVGELRSLFDSISIEIQPMDLDRYQRLAEAGVDGLTLYQEVYDPVVYPRYHPAGPKKIFDRRMRAIEAGGEAGFRSLGIGSLLGLAEWRLEALLLAIHGRYLTRRFWKSRVAVSFPRLQGFACMEIDPTFRVSPTNMVQMICAMRIVLPDAELVLSTRESAAFRDNMIGLGVTRFSAGSRTSPGGYSRSREEHDGEQFDVCDERPAATVAEAIAAKGFEPVWKDFDRTFIPA
jgi:2-iminoacetate synthase